MQTQSPFGPLIALPPALLQSPATVAAAAANGHAPPVSLATFPSAFAAFASQIRSTQLQSLLQSQLQALNGDMGSTGNGPGTPLSRNNYGHHMQNQQHPQHVGKIRGTTEYPLRKRVGGSTVKTAKVWRYFDELPTIEQAAECRICRKKIKATNSSTTGMIRHLRSCHVQEYQLVQEARQNSMIVKMEEKARAKLLREMNEKVISNGIENHPMVVKKESPASESQKSPSASSSASDTASSASSSHFSTNPLIGLPAPVAINPTAPQTPTSTILNLSQSQNQCQNQNPMFKMQNIKIEATEVEEEEIEQKCPTEIHRPTDLSGKTMLLSPKSANLSSAFSSIASFVDKKHEKKVENDHKIHMQIALMLLLDQQPSHVIDRPGFRSLFKFLLPDYHLPSGDIFQATIVPQLLDHMKLQIGAIFNNMNCSSSGSIPDQVMTSSSATSSYEDNSVNESQTAEPHIADEEGELLEEELEEEENVEIEDDTSSASSSMDNDTCDAIASFIHYIGNDSFPHDELISLLSVVTNIFTYFSTRPHVQTHLQMTVSQPTTSQPLVQQVRFVASNLSIISDYIRHTPDMQLLPLAVNQETMLEKLVDHIDQL
ncbi:unnamed protein product [Caenorhabditis nigoni]